MCFSSIYIQISCYQMVDDLKDKAEFWSLTEPVSVRIMVHLLTGSVAPSL